MLNKFKIEKTCYVCGCLLSDYPFDPEDYSGNPDVICPSCGFHYSYDDEGAGDIIPEELTNNVWEFGDKTHIEIIKFWRKYWISNGMNWWSTDNPFTLKPYDWDPEEQLNNVPDEFK